MDKFIINQEFTMEELVQIVTALQMQLKTNTKYMDEEAIKNLQQALDKIIGPGGTKEV